MSVSPSGGKQGGTLGLLLLVGCWFAITHLVPRLNDLHDFRSTSPWILAYFRMGSMLVVTAAYVSLHEKKPLSEGFNFHLRDIRRSLSWAIIFFAVTFGAEKLYAVLVLEPLVPELGTASSSGGEAVTQSVGARVFEYLYIVFEGMVEVLVFTGVLLDRLARRHGWPSAIVASNVVFALWHYPYWKMGWLPGSLLIVLTFIAGSLISLNYMKTRNTLSSALCHVFVDSPSAIRILLGSG
jgi:membrane protease YdiL (CAAX protease family)